MRVLTLLIPAAVGASATLQAQNVLPPVLERHAASIGCTAIADFYDAPGREGPPYVFSYLDGQADPTRENSAVYWCQPGANGEKSRLVIWYATELQGSPPCEPLNWINPAKSLSLDRARRPLSSFSVVDPERLQVIRRGGNPGPAPTPPEGSTSNPIIISTYDGVTEEFNCHEGRWLVRQLH